MIRRQRWTPDTCANPVTGDSCIFLEEWDDSIPAGERVVTLVDRERTCSRHAALEALEAFAANYDENRRKNVTFQLANQIKEIDLSKFSWHFDDAGVLYVSFSGELTNQQRTVAQNYCDVQFGPGKVVIE